MKASGSRPRSKTALKMRSVRQSGVGANNVHCTEAERIAVAMLPAPQLPPGERNRRLKARVTIRKFSFEDQP